MTNAVGIDISQWQSTTPDLSALDFVGVRASHDLTVDPIYAKHAADVKAAGKILIAYHFGNASLNPIDQAKLLVNTAPDANGYALDVEGLYPMSSTQIQMFCTQMHVMGKKIGLYMSQSSFNQYAGQDWNWVAKWTIGAPSIPWTIWQYRGSPLDLDQFNGDVTALRVFFGVDMNPNVDIPYAIADIASGGTVYGDEAESYVLIPNWGGAKDVGIYARGTRLSAVRLDLSTGGSKLVIGWVGTDKVSNVRVPGYVPDCSVQISNAIALDRQKAKIIYS